MRQCFYCKKPTKNPKFCSRSCSIIVSNRVPKRKKKKFFCKTCSKEIASRRSYCDIHAKRGRGDITIQEAIYTKLHKSSAYALIRSRARKVMENEERVCAWCGYSRHVEVCHRTPISKLPPEMKISKANEKENLILLCPNCHWEHDRGR